MTPKKLDYIEPVVKKVIKKPPTPGKKKKTKSKKNLTRRASVFEEDKIKTQANTATEIDTETNHEGYHQEFNSINKYDEIMVSPRQSLQEHVKVNTPKQPR